MPPAEVVRSERRKAVAARYGWKPAMVRVSLRVMSAQFSLVAAGCAFYATPALFPALSMLLFLYGLVFDPVTVEPQLRQLSDLLPRSVVALISARVLDLVSRPGDKLSIGLAVSSATAVWSAMTSTKAMLSALSLAYRQEERRGVVDFHATALAMTLGATLIATVTLAVLMVTPVLLPAVGVSDRHLMVIRPFGRVVLMAAVPISLALPYRFGPSRHHGRRRWLTVGACIAMVLWLAAAVLFSLYVGTVAAYDATYGPLATPPVS